MYTIKVDKNKKCINRNVESYISISDHKIRKIWLDAELCWYFSVIDIVDFIVNTKRPRKYWNEFRKLRIERNGTRPDQQMPEWKIQLSEKFRMVGMPSPDGKRYKTTVTDAQTAMWLVRYIGNATLFRKKNGIKNEKKLSVRVSLCRRELRRYII